jgi:hypothetical protein
LNERLSAIPPSIDLTRVQSPTSTNQIGLPPTDQPDYPMSEFGSILAANVANYAGLADFTDS